MKRNGQSETIEFLKRNYQEAQRKLAVFRSERERAESAFEAASDEMKTAQAYEQRARAAFQDAVLANPEANLEAAHSVLRAAQDRVRLAQERRDAIAQVIEAHRGDEATEGLLVAAMNAAGLALRRALVEDELSRIPQEAIDRLHCAFALADGSPWAWPEWTREAMARFGPRGSDSEEQLARLRSEAMSRHGLSL